MAEAERKVSSRRQLKRRRPDSGRYQNLGVPKLNLPKSTGLLEIAEDGADDEEAAEQLAEHQGNEGEEDKEPIDLRTKRTSLENKGSADTEAKGTELYEPVAGELRKQRLKTAAEALKTKVEETKNIYSSGDKT